MSVRDSCANFFLNKYVNSDEGCLSICLQISISSSRERNASDTDPEDEYGWGLMAHDCLWSFRMASLIRVDCWVVLKVNWRELEMCLMMIFCWYFLPGVYCQGNCIRICSFFDVDQGELQVAIVVEQKSRPIHIDSVYFHKSFVLKWYDMIKFYKKNIK